MKKKNLYEILFSALVVFVPLYFVRISFFTADDYLLSYILNGSMGGYNWDLIYPKLAYSSVLAVCSALAPDINVLTSVYAVLMTVSIYVWVHQVFTHKNRLARLIVLTVSVIMPYYMCFTVVAYMAESAGMIGIFYLLTDQEYRMSKYVLPIILFCTGAAIRPVTALSICALALPTVLYVLCRQRRNLWQWGTIVLSGLCIAVPMLAGLVAELSIPAGIALAGCTVVGYRVIQGQERSVVCMMRIFAVAAAVIVGFGCFQKCAVETAGLKEFYQYTKARSAVVDAPPVSYEEIKKELGEIGISETDYKLLRQWIFIDKEKFSEEKLSKISAIIDDVDRPLMRGQNLLVPIIGVFYLLPAVFAAVMAWKSSKKEKGFLALTLIILYILFTYLWSRRRFQYYVAWPLSVAAILQMAVLSKDVLPGKGKEVIMAVVMAILTITIQAKWYLESGYRDHSLPDNLRAMRETVSADQSKIYIMQGGVYNQLFFRKNPAVAIAKTNQFKNIIKAGSGDSFSSRYYAQMRELNIKNPDRLILELAKDDRLYYVGYNGEVIQSYLEEQMKRDVSMEIVMDNDVKIYKYSCPDNGVEEGSD